MLSYIKRKYWHFRFNKEPLIHDWVLAFFCEIKTQSHYLFQRHGEHHHLPGRLIISLTSYPPRFKKLHLTLKSLINQKINADKIVLWIAVGDREKLPLDVKRLQKKGKIDIEFCEDLGPGKKILPALVNYVDNFIVTADDDLYYKPDWLDKLIDEWDPAYNYVIAHRVHRLRKRSDGVILPYSEWEIDVKDTEVTPFNFATGCAGIFYPPGSLYSEVTDSRKYQELCAMQDDIWLYWMTRLNDNMVKKTTYDFKLVSWSGTEQKTLYQKNNEPEGNDSCLSRMKNEYGLPC